MPAKQVSFHLRGMQRDLSVSKFSPEYAYENMNLRFTVDKDNTLLSIVNEKGTRQVELRNQQGVLVEIRGQYVGSNVLNDIVTIFTSDVSDRIYRLIYNADQGDFRCDLLFAGDLDFNEAYPIETLGVYENEDIQKVYWLDGLNQPRFINVAPSYDHTLLTANSFDFAQSLKLDHVISVSKNTDGSGVFAPGVIQYAFSYFNRYGQESGIFYTTPLNYISHNNRGGSPEESVNNSFTINMNMMDSSFEYVRIYSIHRTSLDAAPVVKRVADVSLNESIQLDLNYLGSMTTYTFNTMDIDDMVIHRDNRYILARSFRYDQTQDPILGDIIRTWPLDLKAGDTLLSKRGNPQQGVHILNDQRIEMIQRSQSSGTITIKVDALAGDNIDIYSYSIVDSDTSKVVFVDNGTTGEDIDPSELLFKGSEEITAGTFAQKDNTLFLGDIKILRDNIGQDIKDQISGGNILFKADENLRDINMAEPSGLYPYDNQLNSNSSEIKGFKYLEWYRFGVQFQHKTGKWSEPIFVNDRRNETPVQVSEDLLTAQLPSASWTLDNYSMVADLISMGYTRARGVVVYPDASSRDVIAQGVLMPTLFNVGDRSSGMPFSISSWFSRPNSPFDYMRSFNDSTPLDPNKPVSRRDFLLDVGSRDGSSLVEHRHYRPIGGYSTKKGEIQVVGDAPISPFVTSQNQADDIENNWNEAFYVDQSILTFHSPEIEIGEDLRDLESSDLSLRIVGMVPVTGSASSISITSKSPVRPGASNISSSTSDEIGLASIGFYDRSPSFSNLSRLAARQLSTGINWFDALDLNAQFVPGGIIKAGFAVYPWHRNGTLTNQSREVEDDEMLFSLIEHNRRSNLKFSYNSYYYPTGSIWDSSNPQHANGISGVAVFDSNELSMVKVPAPKNSGLDDITYYGNVDKIVRITEQGSRAGGYPIMASTTGLVINESAKYKEDLLAVSGDVTLKGTDPAHIKYKSSPHAVLALNFYMDKSQVILPTIQDKDANNIWTVNPITKPAGSFPFWDKSMTSQGSIRQHVMDSPTTGGNTGNIGYGYFWLAELYNSNVQNRFGGDSESAIENNLWFPAGDSVSLIDENNQPKTPVEIVYTEGDTFYQRYDCLKTYPFTDQDQNSVTDIVSFMCETRINIDGRYDRNRGQKNNLSINRTNFNLLNPVYSQENNFFNYRSLNNYKLHPDAFRNVITWSKAKSLGELTDTWANITLASTLDLDGDKGPVRALRRFNNEIFSFQDKGIARVLFNSRVQVNASDGVPIEIANSYKVDGKVYISQDIGVSNKWSIVSTSNGLYFVDDLSKSMFWFGSDGMQSISDSKGFRTYISQNVSHKKWLPKTFDNFISHYDSANRDIYLTNSERSLVYSENLGEFTSFYNYEKVPFMFNNSGKNFMLKDGAIWEQWGGAYNNFFGEVKPFYSTVVVNPEQNLDKIFNTLEYRADTYSGDNLLSNKTFDKLETWNEYQKGSLELKNIFGRPSSLKKKYRIWRTNIPRDEGNGRDRMRNPWLYLKLSMEQPEDTRTELHDMQVTYFTK